MYQAVIYLRFDPIPLVEDGWELDVHRDHWVVLDLVKNIRQRGKVHQEMSLQRISSGDFVYTFDIWQVKQTEIR